MKQPYCCLFFAILSLLISCDNKPKQTIQHDQRTPSLSLDDFKGIPPEIDGCSCYFSADSVKFKTGYYVFAAGYDSLATISVNKKPVKLKLLKTDSEDGTFRDYDHTEIYRNELFTVTVKINYKRSSGEETWLTEGTITIEDTAGQKLVRKFFGECGC